MSAILIVLGSVILWSQFAYSDATDSVAQRFKGLERSNRLAAAINAERHATTDLRSGGGAASRKQVRDARTEVQSLLRGMRENGDTATSSAARTVTVKHNRYVSASDQLLTVFRTRPVSARGPALRAESAAYEALPPLLAREHERLAGRERAAITSLTSSKSLALTVSLIAIGLGLGLVLWMMRLLRSLRAREATDVGARMARLQADARTDQLTGLGNRRALLEDIAVRLASVPDTESTCLLMVDLDGLKQTNERFGHMAGDDRIRLLGSTLVEVSDGTQTGYRLGGDEFAVILAHANEPDGFRFAQRVQEVMRQKSSADDSPTIAAGVAAVIGRSDDSELRRRADLALISAKSARGQILVYTPEVEVKSPVQLAKGDRTQVVAQALALAVEAKDPLRESSDNDVADLARAIGQQFGFDKAHCDQIALAGVLHDVGILGVSDTILQAPHKLSADQMRVIEAHAILGSRIVDAAGMTDIGRWIRHHHERVDGRGYPDGLAGQAIPLESRILFVADAFCALTSDRPHRTALSVNMALQELDKNVGSQFDAQCVEALRRAVAGESLAAAA